MKMTMILSQENTKRFKHHVSATKGISRDCKHNTEKA